MNPAARSAFACRLEDFSASLPPSLVRRFARFVEGKEGGLAKVKLPGAGSLNCTIEILKLADGKDGLIVAEVGDVQEHVAVPTLSGTQKPKKGPKQSVRNAPFGSARRRQKASKTPPELSADEMRAFKAVGRKVLRLCEERKFVQSAAAAPLPAPAPSSCANFSLASDSSTRALADVLAAFDLVLLLGESLDIVGLQGHPSRFGWRKAELSGKAVGDLLAPPDRAILRRMLRRLRGQAACGCRNTLLIQGENGNAAPCRAVVGRFGEDGAACFLALMSLAPPVNMKRSERSKALAATRLAA